MMNRFPTPWKLAATALLSLLVASHPGNAAEFFFKKGDKVVMMGDSITEQHMDSSYLEAWALTRFS